ncbi:MAG: efflux RND transporter periplasmic adaptor subunit [Pyrinomonadaceae bacterium]|nr:efflux RND transporter periplasmic adaptor subunit [Pyrinomonadaceae bacterium]
MIQRSKQGAYFLVLACLITFLLTATGCSGSGAKAKNDNAKASPTSPQAVDVTTAPAILRQLPRFIEATGSLAADEQTDLAPQVAGRVVAVAVELGSYVQRGQVVVRLDSSDAQLRLQQAQAQVEQAQAGVRQAEARIGLRSGQAFDPTRVAEVGASRAALELAEKQLRRYERLVETGDVSRSAYDQQKAQRDQLREQYQAAVQAARQNYAGVQTARAAVDAARTQVDQARKAINDATVVSPMSGYVADRPADVGEYVTSSSKVATIVRTNPMRVRINVPEQSIGQIAPGQSVSAATSAYPDRSFGGRVDRISPGLDPTSRTLVVEAVIENPDGALKPGQFATVRILQPTSEPAVLVPARAVTGTGVSGAESRRVFVIRDGRAEERVVQTGQMEGDLIEIRSGVRADELVATSNLEALRDGAQVRQ